MTNTTPTPNACLVHDWLTGMRGGENVLEKLANLLPKAPILTLFHFPGSVSPALESHPIRTSFLQRAPFVKSHYRWYLPFFPAAIEGFSLGDFDLVVSTSHCVAKGVLPGPQAWHVSYCHTPMRYAWDQEHAYFPKRHGLAARIRGHLLSKLRIWDAASAHRVDQFVANSNFVAERIRRYYGRSAQVVSPPVDTVFFTPNETEPREDFALAVSAMVPYKRIDWALEATQKLGIPLTVVGSGPERERLLAQASGGVRFLENISREKLRDLYRRATFFIQPAVEDFGIASAEALACGTPVVATGKGGILDIVRHGVEGTLTPINQTPSQENLQSAIDIFRSMRFNVAALRRRAEEFSEERFLMEMKPLMRRPPRLEVTSS